MGHFPANLGISLVDFSLCPTKLILAAMYIGNAFESMSEHFQWLTMSTGKGCFYVRHLTCNMCTSPPKMQGSADLSTLVQIMCATFAEHCPVYSKAQHTRAPHNPYNQPPSQTPSHYNQQPGYPPYGQPPPQRPAYGMLSIMITLYQIQ